MRNIDTLNRDVLLPGIVLIVRTRKLWRPQFGSQLSDEVGAFISVFRIGDELPIV
jgi:hypothetical protein